MTTGESGNNRDTSYAPGRKEPGIEHRKTARVMNLFDLSPTAILVNIISDTQVGQRTLERMASLALKAGGTMELCNGEIAVFAFPEQGILAFMEGLGYEIRVLKTMVSPREKGSSKVNIRFKSPGS
jgi:hypothetical protein